MKNKESKVEDLMKLSKDGKITVKHLHGPAKEYLKPVKPIEKIALVIAGNVGTIAEFLRKRIELFDKNNCHIQVSLDENLMQFVGNECEDNNVFMTVVESQIKETKHYTNLDVNNEREFEALELSRYLRKRKNMFIDPEQFQNVWAALSSFKAEISKQVENADSRDGNAVNSIKQQVTHNMPRHFELMVPVFEGVEPIKIEIEVDVNPNSLECSLMSFDLEHKYDDLKESLFEAELDQVISVNNMHEDREKVIASEIKLRDFCVTYYS